jgi:hypothetical protein
MRVRDQTKRDTLVLQVGRLRRWTKTPTLAKKSVLQLQTIYKSLGTRLDLNANDFGTEEP